jgi:ATP-binding cassette subfamily B protein
VNFLTGMVERLVSSTVLLLHVLIVGFGAWLAFHKRISIGTLVTFESVFWELSYNIGYLSQFLPEAIQAAGAIQHMQELLDEAPLIEDAPGAVELPHFEREIVFENVSFGYGGGRGLRDVSLCIPRGAKVVLAGPSGSGKSTLLSLLLRLYDPQRGAVKIDGRDVRSVTRQSLRAQMAVVFQESFLFNATMAENIRLGKPGATDEEVRNAARAAEIHDFIESLPEGYDTMAGERGGRMSGGQRQRMAIARALVRDPAILILDEATSALDAATADAVLATLRRVSAGRTVIMATHRVESVVDADFVFKLGEAGA